MIGLGFGGGVGAMFLEWSVVVEGFWTQFSNPARFQRKDRARVGLTYKIRPGSCRFKAAIEVTRSDQ